MKKKILDRFDKDVKGALTTLLIIGIIIEGKRVWTYQIKKRFRELSHDGSTIPDSTLYSTLNKLENDYGILISENDPEVQRRFFFISEEGKREFFRIKSFWFNIFHSSEKILNGLRFDFEESKK